MKYLSLSLSPSLRCCCCCWPPAHAAIKPALCGMWSGSARLLHHEIWKYDYSTGKAYAKVLQHLIVRCAALKTSSHTCPPRCSHRTMRIISTAKVLQGLLHMPQLLSELWAFAVLFAAPRANLTWSMWSKHHNTGKVHVEVLQNLILHRCMT